MDSSWKLNEQYGRYYRLTKDTSGQSEFGTPGETEIDQPAPIGRLYCEWDKPGGSRTEVPKEISDRDQRYDHCCPVSNCSQRSKIA